MFTIGHLPDDLLSLPQQLPCPQCHSPGGTLRCVQQGAPAETGRGEEGGQVSLLAGSLQADVSLLDQG